MDSVKLRTKDGHDFEIKEDVAKCITLVRDMLENATGGRDVVVPLIHVAAQELKIILKWLEHHMAVSKVDMDEACDLDEWDVELFKQYDLDAMCQLAMATNYLNMEGLTTQICKSIGSNVINKRAPELRAFFGLKPSAEDCNDK